MFLRCSVATLPALRGGIHAAMRHPCRDILRHPAAWASMPDNWVSAPSSLPRRICATLLAAAANAIALRGAGKTSSRVLLRFSLAPLRASVARVGFVRSAPSCGGSRGGAGAERRGERRTRNRAHHLAQTVHDAIPAPPLPLWLRVRSSPASCRTFGGIVPPTSRLAAEAAGALGKAGKTEPAPYPPRGNHKVVNNLPL